jgi:hypothetical protein
LFLDIKELEKTWSEVICTAHGLCYLMSCLGCCCIRCIPPPVDYPDKVWKEACELVAQHGTNPNDIIKLNGRLRYLDSEDKATSNEVSPKTIKSLSDIPLAKGVILTGLWATSKMPPDKKIEFQRKDFVILHRN